MNSHHSLSTRILSRPWEGFLVPIFQKRTLRLPEERDATRPGPHGQGAGWEGLTPSPVSPVVSHFQLKSPPRALPLQGEPRGPGLCPAGAASDRRPRGARLWLRAQTVVVNFCFVVQFLFCHTVLIIIGLRQAQVQMCKSSTRRAPSPAHALREGRDLPVWLLCPLGRAPCLHTVSTTEGFV